MCELFSGLGLKCLRCDDVTYPQLCMNLEYCSGGDVSTRRPLEELNSVSSRTSGKISGL